MVRTRAQRRKEKEEAKKKAQEEAAAAQSSSSTVTLDSKLDSLLEKKLEEKIDEIVEKILEKKKSGKNKRRQKVSVAMPSNDSDFSDDSDSSSESESSDSSSVVSSSSWKKVKVDWALLPVFDPKEGFEDWERQWGDFMKEELRRSRFGSSGQWKRMVWMGMYKAAKNDSRFKSHLKRFFHAGLKHKEVLRRVKEEYLSNLLVRQLAVEEKVKEFPYDTNRRSAAGEVLKPKIKFGFKTLRRRLSNLEVEAMGVQRPIEDTTKPTMIFHALDSDQKNILITAIRAQKGEMLLDLNLLSWDDIHPHLDWFAAIEEKEKGGEGGREKAGRSSNPKGGYRGNDHGRQRENGNTRESSEQGSSGSSGQGGQHPVYYTCRRKHEGECWAKKKNIECKDCGEKGHYADAPTCKKKGGSSSSSGGGKGD
uniref:Uncharacterized protein n=1 Tax=Chromera velia CCMP2878 TaxID=1169474 RepID=A0A0G4F6I3_9ALVE|eukprot:Cvel_15275.t1-p1 / transcript=Cvel_15275.t1 / gene=Cvel_15275 / organism=Chromera_velia_CCMP2878 / gene_product=hypothetical protein / transcript_product=hypothetical protein / location=Cvel_scaffold1121:1246-2508(-) / protein_length=421 / sequence_SO=supercontig / SO=protein_coding / is_pseudo=false